MQRAFPLSLALLTLLSSVSISVDRHFCMGELKSVVFFGEAEVCPHEQFAAKTMPANCPFHPAPATDTSDCCDDEQELLESDDDRQLADAPALPQFTLATLPPAVPVPSALHLRPRTKKTFQRYRPPPLVIDVPSQWQVFRL
jgi:hypothetical protein